MPRPAWSAIQDPFDVLAPDGSEVRLQAGISGRASAACFRLPPGQTAQAVRHRTVDEIWHVLGGRGEMWLAHVDAGDSQIVALQAGVTVTIPLGTSFQFRNLGDGPLDIFGVTMPPWPTDREEAVFVDGPWPAGATGG